MCIYIPVPVIWFGCCDPPPKRRCCHIIIAGFGFRNLTLIFALLKWSWMIRSLPSCQARPVWLLAAVIWIPWARTTTKSAQNRIMTEIPKILAFLGPNPVTLTEPPGIRNGRQQQTRWDKESGVRFLSINFFINEKIQIMVTESSHTDNFSFKQALPSHKELIILKQGKHCGANAA